MAINEIVIQHVPLDREDTPDILRQVKESGFTAVQLYTFWKDFEPHAEGQFEWEHFDSQVRQIQAAGLKWILFLPMGPKYANPQWWMDDPRHQGLICLEHGRECPDESIWNPAFRKQVSRVLKALAEHYLPWDVIQSVQPGISGDYGEALMPSAGNWPGDYHTHMGYWSGDEYATADFRRALEEKYGDIAALNTAWRTRYDGFHELAPFMPHRAPSRTALYDMLRWYKDAMNEYTEFWVSECRKYFPDTPIYLSTGGSEEPELAADFVAQVKVCAKYNAGIRLTNENSDFFYNYLCTILTQTACEHYDTYIGLEPAGYLTAAGVGARMFGSAVYGNRQMMYYYYNMYRDKPDENGLIGDERAECFTRYLPLLSERKLSCDVAIFWPGVVGAFGHGIPEGMHGPLFLLRRLAFAKAVNETLIADGALDDVNLLIIPPAPCTDRETLLRIVEFVKNGGHVLAIGQTGDIELNPVAEYDELFGILPECDWGRGGATYRVRTDRFPRTAKVRPYGCGLGMHRLHPDVIEITGCDFWGENYSGTTTAAMSNVFMREYPSGGTAVMYLGFHDYGYDPNAEQHSIFPSLLMDMLEMYSEKGLYGTKAGEMARGYINGELYAYHENGEITKVE